MARARVPGRTAAFDELRQAVVLPARGLAARTVVRRTLRERQVDGPGGLETGGHGVGLQCRRVVDHRLEHPYVVASVSAGVRVAVGRRYMCLGEDGVAPLRSCGGRHP